MITDRTGYQYGIARPHLVARQGETIRQHADTGSRNENTVSFTLFDNFGITGDQLYASLAISGCNSSKV